MVMAEELQMYRNFDDLAKDVLDLAKEIMPDQLIYLTSFTDSQQVILKLSDLDTNILLTEGMKINLEETVCDRVDFETMQPLVFEDVDKECPDDLTKALKGANIQSYLGIPISRVNGDRFGTLCAVHSKESEFDNKSIQLLQRIVRLFSYYLDLERFAFRDTLTDLYNRRYITQFFEEHSEDGGRIFFLDLDGFKKVNDSYGHDEGDLVLKEVASRLQKFAAKHENAFAVRLGGDEFLIHFSDLPGPVEMKEQADRLLDSLSKWDSEYQLSASMGIVTYPVHYSGGLSTLLKNADQALYRAKIAGKNRYEFSGQTAKENSGQ